MSATSSAIATSRWTACSPISAACRGSSRQPSSFRSTLRWRWRPRRERIPGAAVPSPTEVPAASLNWAFVNRKAKRELGWTTSPHEDCHEETVAHYRERDADRIPPGGARQPVALRLAGGTLRRLGV